MAGRRAFSVAGPMVWNSLPDELRDPACGSDSFKQFLKTFLVSLVSANMTSTLEIFLNDMCCVSQIHVLLSYFYILFEV